MSRNHCSAGLSFGASFRCPLPLWLLEHIRNVCRSSRWFSWYVKWSERCSVVSNSLLPRGLYSPWNSPVQNTGVGSLSLLQGNLPNPGIERRSPTLQADSLPAEPPGKPKNTGVGSLSLLQQICLTQESSWSLLHCRRILYQLSYQGSPCFSRKTGCFPIAAKDDVTIHTVSKRKKADFQRVRLVFGNADALIRMRWDREFPSRQRKLKNPIWNQLWLDLVAKWKNDMS